jgi:hypothetical protein
MKIFIGQVYIKPGVSFEFSHRMQLWLGEQMSLVACDSTRFQNKFGRDFDLMIRVSADTQITDNRIKGPAVFRKSKDVEYTVFLPFDVISKATDGCRAALTFLLAGIHSVFQQAGIDTKALDEQKNSIIEHICSDPTMLSEPWPSG